MFSNTITSYFKKVIPLLILVSSLCVLIEGCGFPKEEERRQDFLNIFNKEVGVNVKPVILSFNIGEGDFEDAYEYIKFDVIAEKDVEIPKGWLHGLILKKGQKLCNGEVEILYQKKQNKKWEITHYSLSKLPGSCEDGDGLN
jgi:hypothetical protein